MQCWVSRICPSLRIILRPGIPRLWPRWDRRLSAIISEVTQQGSTRSAGPNCWRCDAYLPTVQFRRPRDPVFAPDKRSEYTASYRPAITTYIYHCVSDACAVGFWILWLCSKQRTDPQLLVRGESEHPSDLYQSSSLPCNNVVENFLSSPFPRTSCKCYHGSPETINRAYSLSPPNFPIHIKFPKLILCIAL